jgi:glycosyltransferase involved in cell wall biosynthesis
MRYFGLKCFTDILIFKCKNIPIHIKMRNNSQPNTKDKVASTQSQTLPVSIIIPAKNEEACIGRLLESINRQEYKPAEVIVADGSDDNTAEIAKDQGAIVVEGGELFFARNTGAKLAKENIFIFLDADVELPDALFLKRVYDEFTESGADVAGGLFRLDSFSTRNLVSNIVYTCFNWLCRLTDVLSDRLLFITTGFFQISKREVFEEINGYKELPFGVPEDLDFMIRAIRTGAKYTVIHETLLVEGRRFTKPLRSLISIIGITLGGVWVRLGWYDKKNLLRFTAKMYGKSGERGEVESGT